MQAIVMDDTLINGNYSYGCDNDEYLIPITQSGTMQNETHVWADNM